MNVQAAGGEGILGGPLLDLIHEIEGNHSKQLNAAIVKFVDEGERQQDLHQAQMQQFNEMKETNAELVHRNEIQSAELKDLKEANAALVHRNEIQSAELNDLMERNAALVDQHEAQATVLDSLHARDSQTLLVRICGLHREPVLHIGTCC